MKIVFSILFVVLLVGSVNALEVKVVRDAPSEIFIGEVLDVNISVFSDEDLDFRIREQFSDNLEFIDPLRATEFNYNGIKQYKLEWQSDVPAGRVKVFNYRIRPLELGEFNLVSTKVLVNDSIYESDVLSVLVKCVPDGKCLDGENYLNCREDCLNGVKDGVCDFKVDGICDLDCSEDVDCEYLDVEKKGLFAKITDFFRNLFG